MQNPSLVHIHILPLLLLIQATRVHVVTKITQHQRVHVVEHHGETAGAGIWCLNWAV